MFRFLFASMILLLGALAGAKAEACACAHHDESAPRIHDDEQACTLDACIDGRCECTMVADAEPGKTPPGEPDLPTSSANRLPEVRCTGLAIPVPEPVAKSFPSLRGTRARDRAGPPSGPATMPRQLCCWLI